MRILLPIRFDQLSENAFLQAYNLCLKSNAQLDVLAVYDAGLVPNLSRERTRSEWKEKLSSYTREKLERFIQLYPNMHRIASKRTDINCIVGERPLWQRAKELHEEKPYDLILWPYRSFKPIIELFDPRPDITELLANIKGNILVLPSRNQLKEIERLIFAAMLTEEEKQRISQGVRIKEQLNAQSFDIVKIKKDEGEYSIWQNSDLLRVELDRLGVDHIHFIPNPSVLQGLKDSIHTPQKEILCIYLPHRNLVGKLLHYHLSRDLIHKTDLGLLFMID